MDKSGCARAFSFHRKWCFSVYVLPSRVIILSRHILNTSCCISWTVHTWSALIWTFFPSLNHPYCFFLRMIDTQVWSRMRSTHTLLMVLFGNKNHLSADTALFWWESRSPLILLIRYSIEHENNSRYVTAFCWSWESHTHTSLSKIDMPIVYKPSYFCL